MRRWADVWFGYTREDKIRTVYLVGITLSLPVIVSAFAVYVLFRRGRL
jgi:hypothetical protein